MKDKLELIHYLLEYEKFVAHCNQLITEYYQLCIPLILARNTGIIPISAIIRVNHEELNYSFHGIGCLCKLNSRIIDFDYCFGTFEYKGFETYAVWAFIESDLNERRALTDKSLFVNALLDLEAKGIICKYHGQLDTYEYVLNREMIQALNLSTDVE